METIKQKTKKCELTNLLLLVYLLITLFMFAFVNMPGATHLNRICAPYIAGWVVDWHTNFTYIFLITFIIVMLYERGSVYMNGVTLLLAVKCIVDGLTLLILGVSVPFSVYASTLGMLVSYFLASQITSGEKVITKLFIIFASILAMQAIFAMSVSIVPYLNTLFKEYMVIPYGASNIIASALVPMFFFHKKIENKLFKWQYILLIIVGIFATKSRGGMLLFAACLAVEFLLYCIKNKKWKLLISLALIAIAGVGVLFCFEKFRTLIIGFAANNLTLDGLTTGRISLWISNLWAGLELPIFGHGLGAYHTSAYGVPQDAHNLIVGLFYRCGIVGVVLYAWALALVFKQAKKEKKLSSVWFVFLVIMLANSMFEVCYQSYKCDVIFWFIAGLLNRRQSAEESAKNNPKKVYYLGYYDVQENANEKRGYVLSATTKMQYMCKAFMDAGYEVEILSMSATSSTKQSFPFQQRTLENGATLTLMKTKKRGNKLQRIIEYFVHRLRMLHYVNKHMQQNDILLVYHSIELCSLVSLVKFFNRPKLIMEVNEIYADVSGNTKVKKMEYAAFKRADGYVLPTVLLNEKINAEGKPYTLNHGTYQPQPVLCEKRADGKVHCVYAGTFDMRKGGAIAAANAAKYLDGNYHMHIIGFGEEADKRQLLQAIEEISSQTECKLTFDGLFSGEEYLRFLQGCHIGLSTQDPSAAFNDTSFPSKILSYMANGLQVVSIKIPAIQTSLVGGEMYYYDEQTPQAIAEAIRSVDVNSQQTPREVLTRLDKDFVEDIKRNYQ